MFGPRRRTLRVTRLRGLPVLDAHVARQAGIVSELLIDRQGRLAALEVAHGDGYLRRQVTVDRVRALRRNMVVVQDAAELSFLPSHPVATGLINLKTLVGLPVHDEAGGSLGRVADAFMDADEMSVSAYALARPLWRRWQPSIRLPAASVVSFSTELLVVNQRPAAEPSAGRSVARGASAVVVRAGSAVVRQGRAIWRVVRTGYFRRAKI